MDIPKAVQAISNNLDELEGSLGHAHDEASNASSEAYDAKHAAERAEEQADECVSSIENAQSELEEVREAFNELQERIDEMEQNEDGEKSPGLSDLQKDIARNKVRVLAAKKTHPSASAATIASALGIGEFLVKRILELEAT
jgi:chromosome segregation ATPase